MSRAAPRRRTGIRDVAAAAGVSTTTVSHALSGKGRLPEATRARVRAVAEELGYRPNPSAQQLVGGRTGLLGITVAHPGATAGLGDVSYFVELLSAASTTALSQGYALVMSTTGGGEGAPWANVPLDGGVVVDPVADDPGLAGLRAAGSPVVTTGRVPGAPDAGPWVDNDHVAGTHRLLEHLESAGARRVALITPPPLTSYAIDLNATYLAWCARRGVRPRVATARGDLGGRSGVAAAAELLADDPPDAILAALDRLALGALVSASAAGLRVPEDLLVAGYTDAVANQWTSPGLTALQLHPGEIGRRATERLIAIVEGADDGGARGERVGTRIVPRGSTDRTAAPGA